MCLASLFCHFPSSRNKNARRVGVANKKNHCLFLFIIIIRFCIWIKFDCFTESSHRSESGSGFWQLQLDRDLVDTISAIYPEWFHQHNMAEGGGGGGSSPSSTTPRESPPKAVIDTSPLHIDQNKECKNLFILYDILIKFNFVSRFIAV